VGLFTESVPRDLYDRKCAEYDALLDKYHALRMAGAEPVTKIRTTLQPPDGAAQTLKAAEMAASDPNVRRVAEKFMAQGMAEPVALREAKRLADIARGRVLPPNLATPPEPEPR
jgi:hypothetical protein